MTIKVISEGTPFTATCKSCRSVVEYNYTDTYVYSYTVARGMRVGHGAYRCITCPVCSSRIRHNG